MALAGAAVMANGAPHGSRDLRRMAAQVKPVEDTSEEGRAWVERKVGLRCGGCGERIVKGFEFVRLQVLKDPVTGERAAVRSTVHACVRPDCDFVMEVAQTATAARKLDNEWLFMDDPRLAGIFNDAEMS